MDQEKRLREQLNETEQKIQKYQLDKLAKQRMSEADDDEDLDEFMSHLSREKQLDKTEIRKLRVNYLIHGFPTKKSNLFQFLHLVRSATS